MLGYCFPSNLLTHQAPASSVTEQRQPKAWDDLFVPARTCSGGPPVLWQSCLTRILVPATVVSDQSSLLGSKPSFPAPYSHIHLDPGLCLRLDQPRCPRSCAAVSQQPINSSGLQGVPAPRQLPPCHGSSLFCVRKPCPYESSWRSLDEAFPAPGSPEEAHLRSCVLPAQCFGFLLSLLPIPQVARSQLGLAGPLCWSVTPSVRVDARLPFCEVQLALALLGNPHPVPFGICSISAAAAATVQPPAATASPALWDAGSLCSLEVEGQPEGSPW